MAKKEKASGHTKLVIVESPTKAKTIRRFLGQDYVVESCMGHVRDLPQSAKDIPESVKKQPWAQLGVNVDQHFEPLYCVPKDKTKVVKNLKDKLKEASELYLATDEDREGESISWHLVEVLRPGIPTKRMVFNEITKEAIQKALKETRPIDNHLVKAQEARRVLDRLVGYTISPLIWKKVAYGLSAGRVQSVAVRLITEREHERIRFKKAEYWSVEAQLLKDKIEFGGRAVSVKGQKIATGKDFDGLTGALEKNKDVLVLDASSAERLVQSLKGQNLKVVEVEEKPVHRKPAPPFITSTLQQESNRKLGLSSRETMQVAQKLYEQGFITYMRTDSTFLSEEALTAAREDIKKRFGKEYLPEAARNYAGKKVKGAQEAHEAIRPAGTSFIVPDETGLSGTQLRLYELIWMRTMASQMRDAIQKQVQTRLQVGDVVFSANGMTIEFPGFLRAYVEGSDDPEAELLEREVRLPHLAVGDIVAVTKLEPQGHETKPPARYTEASLVQTMEKEGIGRPSTYASIIGTIIDRGYVKKEGNALTPTFTAMVVSKLLRQYLPKYVDLDFTSKMEKSLDDIADGDLDWEKYLSSIYFGKTGLKEQVAEQGEKINPEEARAIILEGLEDFSFRVGRYGAYVCTQKGGAEVCASLPESESPANITRDIAMKLIDQKINGADALGKDPQTGLPVFVLTGRYGPYVQLGESAGEKEKPKRASLPPHLKLEEVTIEMALQLLSLPKLLGQHPTTRKDIKVGLGRFGPYVVCDGDFRSIPRGESLFEVSYDRALELLSQPKKGRSRAAPLKELGVFPGSEDLVNIMNGPYGPYIKCGKTNVSLPEGATIESISLEKALQLIADKTGTAIPAGKAKSVPSSNSKVKVSEKGKKKIAIKEKTGKAAKKMATKTAMAPQTKIVKKKLASIL